MSEIKLNDNIKTLATEHPEKYEVFQRLLKAMSDANNVELPDYNQEPYSTPSGQTWEDPNGNVVQLMVPNEKVIAEKMAEVANIQLQNAAYMFADVIIHATSISTSGIDMSKLVSKLGDQMQGAFAALKGFEAGVQGRKIFDVAIKAAQEYIAHVYGNLVVDGKISVSDDGIYFGNTQAVSYNSASSTLLIASSNILLDGDVVCDGKFQADKFSVTSSGASWDNNSLYHQGNANSSSVNWDMKDAHVYGDLAVDGTISFTSRLTALNGFDIGEDGQVILTSHIDPATQERGVDLLSDVNIINGAGVKLNGRYVISEKNNIVSISAPGKVLNLGDADGTGGTKAIFIQTDITDHTGRVKLVTFDGTGNFPNGFTAGVDNAGPWAMKTYRIDADNYGVVFQNAIALGDQYGARITSAGNNQTLRASLPIVVNNDAKRFNYDVYLGASNSSWHLPPGDTTTDISVHFDTDGEFFIFDKPVESSAFSINGVGCETQLRENILFLRKGAFIEGVANGISFTGNAYFNNNLQSPRFASGVAGYGWGIMKNKSDGSYHATFDELTVRKKMRIFEMEVQKQAATNGSLWITDHCSGDTVEKISD